MGHIKTDFNENMADSNLETPDRSKEVKNPSFLLLNGLSFMFTIACLGLTIFAEAKGNSDLNIFLRATSVLSICLCLLEVFFCTVGFATICKICQIYYILIVLSYAFCVVMTAVKEYHPKSVKECLFINLGLVIARFFILQCTSLSGTYNNGTTTTVGLITGTVII